ncbi:DUF4474 domain-containing protein [Amycolatopsis albispora]|uniref:DUF4474 domain-containing protein n=1 Tax=Amycolatopsis albispora TaxID=1804986 RepID=A0A344L327_9PSEU|nr:DUF4474 domain-containing protein [Amycolatopsis albispora]AXB42451.1 hypothetical protein A4R43_07850 [Amycolatopsis albispora]
MFDRIYDLADKLDQGSTTDLDDRARACRAAKDEVHTAKTALDALRTELDEAWQGNAGEAALADLDDFRRNRERQADDLGHSAVSFEVVRDALEKAQRDARSKREEAKALQAELEKAWQDAEDNPLKLPGAWAKQAKTKVQEALLLLDMERIVRTYDMVLNNEGATIRGMKGHIDEDAGAVLRAERDKDAGVLGELAHILSVLKKNPNLGKSLLMDKLMENPELAKEIYRYFGFKYSENGDFYTTGETSLQSYFGWHDLYDEAGPALGMRLHETSHPNIEFRDPETGKQYRLEAWKGSYGHGGSFGGEVALYAKDADPKGPDNIPGYHSAVTGDDQIRVTQQIYDKSHPDRVYMTNDGQGSHDPDKRHYWNLAIQTDPNVDREQLGQRATIHVEHRPAMRDEMFKAMQRYAEADPTFKPVLNPDGSISYTWEK